MSNILSTSFKSILDNNGERVIEFKFDYNCDNERKESTMIIPLNPNELTQDTVDHYVDLANEHIKQRRNGY